LGNEQFGGGDHLTARRTSNYQNAVVVRKKESLMCFACSSKADARGAKYSRFGIEYLSISNIGCAVAPCSDASNDGDASVEQRGRRVRISSDGKRRTSTDNA